MKNRARYKNIINKSKGISKKETVGDPFDLFVKTMPTELDYYKDSNNYRLKAAWEAYGKPKDITEAYYEGLIDVDRNKLVMPSIGYNEENDTYEYLNTGKENDTVNKDIRVWENDVIPFVKELKNGGYIRTFDEEKNCWMYKKGGKTQSEKQDDYQMFLSVLPENLRAESPDYNMRRYWELFDKPTSWFEALNKKMFSKQPDGYYHAGSVAYNKDTDEYEFMKSPNHPTLLYELDWYNSPEGHKFAKDWQLIKPEDGSNYKYIRRSTLTFKQGGQMNVIPEGALHARKNNMELAEEGEITHKGIPVVDKEGGQVAEVEKEEITFTKPVTEKLEDWYKKFYSEDISDKEKDELAIKCGKFIAKEILFNTDDRVGLIEKIKELEGL